MGVVFITEKQDNFRNPKDKVETDKADQLVEYLQNENQSLIKKKIYNNLLEKDEMENFTTEYRVQSKKHDVEKDRTSKSLHDHFKNVTVAGKPRYLE